MTLFRQVDNAMKIVSSGKTEMRTGVGRATSGTPLIAGDEASHTLSSGIDLRALLAVMQENLQAREPVPATGRSHLLHRVLIGLTSRVLLQVFANCSRNQTGGDIRPLRTILAQKTSYATRLRALASYFLSTASVLPEPIRPRLPLAMHLQEAGQNLWGSQHASSLDRVSNLVAQTHALLPRPTRPCRLAWRRGHTILRIGTRDGGAISWLLWKPRISPRDSGMCLAIRHPRDVGTRPKTRRAGTACGMGCHPEVVALSSTWASNDSLRVRF
jgi:hypothetical protein